MRDRLHRLRLGHRLGMKFPQRASPVDRKLGDLELMGRPIDPGFKNLASPQNVQFAGVIDLQQRHTVRQIAEAVERQLLERRKVMRRSCRGTPPAQCFDFKRPPRTRRIERRRGTIRLLCINLHACPR
jgi:hypothetical protein